MDVLEEIEELAVPAVRAFDRGLPLIALEPARLDEALALDRRRAYPDRQPVREGRHALVAERDGIAQAGDRILVHLIVIDTSHRAPGEIIGDAGALMGQEAAREGLVEQRLVGVARKKGRAHV